MKDTKNKEKLRLVPRDALVAIAKVREYGIMKYKGDNYHGVDYIEFIDATLRHIYKYLDGQTMDEESGLHHLHHALCSLALAVTNEEAEDASYLDVERYEHIELYFYKDKLTGRTVKICNGEVIDEE